MTVPLDASISLTVPGSSSLFATQMWVPSEDTPWGYLPTGIVRMTPSAEAEDTPRQHAATATVAASTPVSRTTPAREKPSSSLIASPSSCKRPETGFEPVRAEKRAPKRIRCHDYQECSHRPSYPLAHRLGDRDVLPDAPATR